MRALIWILPPLLSACGFLASDTLRALEGFDPLTADPAAYALRVQLPQTVGIEAGQIVLSATHAADGARSEGRYLLEARGETYRIAPAQLPAFRAQQRRIQAWKAGAGAEGSLSVTVTPCAQDGAGPLPAGARFSAQIRSTPDGPFLPLVTGTPLRLTGLDFLPACRQ